MDYSPLSSKIVKKLIMLIGELSKRSGLTRDTIRFYEKKRLITVGWKERRDNNYKEYSEDILEKLLTIKRLKNFGFTLNEASDVLDMIELNEATCHNLYAKIEEKVALMDEKIREMIKIRSMLLDRSLKCKDNCSPSEPEVNCPIIVSKMD